MKIIVPEEMMKAAARAYNAKTSEMGYKYVIFREVVTAAIEAAMLWLAENPIVPTAEQAKGLIKLATVSADRQIPILTPEDWARCYAVEWQKQMFLSPPSTERLYTQEEVDAMIDKAKSETRKEIGSLVRREGWV